MPGLAKAAALLLLVVSSDAFAPASMGSTFVQTRTTAGTTAFVVSDASRRSTTALQMNLFDRFARVAKANINNVLKSLEEPEKILTQALEDMQVRAPRVHSRFLFAMQTSLTPYCFLRRHGHHHS